MLLNLIRVEEAGVFALAALRMNLTPLRADPEFMMARSFRRFQQARTAPKMLESEPIGVCVELVVTIIAAELESLEKKLNEFDIKDATAVRSRTRELVTGRLPRLALLLTL